MKKTLIFFLAMMAVCVSLTSCEKDSDDEGRPYYSKFIDINITRCERVGGVLMVDFTVKNKTDEGLRLTLNDQEVTDNVGTTYVSMWTDNIAHIALGSSEFSSKSNATVVANGEITGQIKVYDFDETNKATSIAVKIGVLIDGKDLADKKYEQGKIAVTDNRVMQHGIQTNDTHLAYQMTSCTVEGNNAYLNFTVTNNTGMSLTDFGMGYAYGGEARVYDNQGNGYDSSIRFGNDDWYHFAAINRFNSGASLQGTLRVENIKATASELTVYIGASAKNYICEDGTVRFLTIPIYGINSQR